jgi:hypothetical protein
LTSLFFHQAPLHKLRVIPFSIPRFSPAEKLLHTKGFSGNYPRPGSYNLTTMYREGYRVLLTLLQFFATKFLFLALHLESGCFPRPLTAREEAAAFSALHTGDAAAREKLIRHNLRLVAHIVKKYYALPGDQEDLVSIGTIGLMKAVDTFDATRKALFSTYASRCIENAILSPAHFQMEKRIHLFHAMTHLRQNGFFGAERAVPLFALSYMAFRKTRSRSSNIAFHAGCPENTACST